MRWHVVEENKDREMRYPRNSKAWKNFDLMHLDIALDPRNVCLGLTTYGFNPFGTLSTNYKNWLVLVIP